MHITVQLLVCAGVYPTCQHHVCRWIKDLSCTSPHASNFNQINSASHFLLLVLSHARHLVSTVTRDNVEFWAKPQNLLFYVEMSQAAEFRSQAAEFRYFCRNCQISGLTFQTKCFLAELIASNQVRSLFRLSMCVCVCVCVCMCVCY